MPLNRLYKIVRLLDEARRYVPPDEDAQDAASAPARHYHKRIVAISVSFGVAGVVLGLSFLPFVNDPKVPAKDIHKILLMPIMFGVGGLLGGVAIAGLFAPRSFLTGPYGAKWMELIGTDKIWMARLVSFLVTLLFLAMIGVFVWAGWMELNGQR